MKDSQLKQTVNIKPKPKKPIIKPTNTTSVAIAKKNSTTTRSSIMKKVTIPKDKLLTQADLARTILRDTFEKHVLTFTKFKTKGNTIYVKTNTGKTYCLTYKTTFVNDKKPTK